LCSVAVCSAMAFLPEWTWYNMAIVAFFATASPLQCFMQTRAEEGAVVWSKFAIGKTHRFPVSARCGMLTKYVPSLLLVAGKVPAGFQAEFGILDIMVLIHFGKRILEVLFLHDFSGSPIEDGVSSVAIGGFYALMAFLYSRDPAQAEGVVLYVGIATFCIGVLGNWYHHFLLAQLRKPAAQKPIETPSLSVEGPDAAQAEAQPQSKYKIPMGGCFVLVTCPHYFFESLGFWGIAVTAFQLIPMTMALSTTTMLAGHALSTTRWYQTKFGDKWPSERKHMIPFIF